LTDRRRPPDTTADQHSEPDQMAPTNDRVFSGIQPSGVPTLGNYLGAIRNWVPMQDTHECIFCVVDLHAITVWQDPQELARQTREMAAALIACGLDPKRCILFLQSHVHAHARLAWIFNRASAG
jgi:tryptophanyl-tRNA synthetase